MASEMDPLTEAVLQWIDKEDLDLRASRVVLENDHILASIAAFHAQQAAEKFLKGLLTFAQLPIRKTHDIGIILESLQNAYPQTVDKDCVILSDYAVDSRYPGDLPEISNEEAQRLVKITEAVRDAVLDALPPRFSRP